MPGDQILGAKCWDARGPGSRGQVLGCKGARFWGRDNKRLGDQVLGEI